LQSMENDITILIGGAAGQGIQTIGALLAKVCHNAGLYIYSTDDFESRVRGGHNFHLLRIGTKPLYAPSDLPDILVAIDDRTSKLHGHNLRPGGIIIANSSKGSTDLPGVYNIPLEQLAQEAGGAISSNTIAAGCVLAAIGARFRDFEKVLKEWFRIKGEKIVHLNLKAARTGYDAGSNIDFPSVFDFTPDDNENIVLSGAKAAALGAVAADCRFFSFYPMSPGTAIISNAVELADKLPLVIEQAEDEPGAINMAIGASFAGVRSLTATSGGGFCLMTEGLGLAGMAEIPVVIINAQRPGPATGLATRTAQADLLFVINSSQDEFPRFVFAPGSPHKTFDTVKRAFYLSEKYQVPAIVLMDQFLMDSSCTKPGQLEIGREYESFLGYDTDMYQNKIYHRYALNDTGVSPRILPCTSSALVRSTGNEHSEEGFSLEEPCNRKVMVEKRFKKLSMMTREMEPPEISFDDSQFFLTGWGSSRGCIMDACLGLRKEGIDAGFIIFEDIWPMDGEKISRILENKRLIMVEGNAACQLGTLIRQQTGINHAGSVLKYDGRPMFPSYIMEKAKKVINALQSRGT